MLPALRVTDNEVVVSGEGYQLVICSLYMVVVWWWFSGFYLQSIL